MLIREYSQQRHLDGVRSCAIELQDFEHAIDNRLPRGADIINDYMLQVFHRCMQCQGKILVAEVDDSVAGYAMILTKVEGDGVEDGDLEYGLVADLIVRSAHRGKGIGRQLLDAAETYAISHGVNWLRIGVMSGNRKARNLYESRGFSGVYTELEKDLRRQQPES